MTLKRYRMEIVDGRIQPRHDAGTGEWYAASEVEEELAEYKMRIAVAREIITKTRPLKGVVMHSPDGLRKMVMYFDDGAIKTRALIKIEDFDLVCLLTDFLHTEDLDAFLETNPEYKPE